MRTTLRARLPHLAVFPLVFASAACATTGRSGDVEPAAQPAVAAQPRAADTATAVAPAAPPTRRPDVIFVPTPMPVVEQMLVLAGVDARDTVFDLGSGDGRIVIGAAKRGAKAIGIDIDPERIRESRANADTSGVAARTEFRQADLFETDLRSATAVTLYLLPSLNVKLRPKLMAELRPGTPVVSNSFDMGDWKADSTVAIERTVHLWYIPATVGGTWTVSVGEGASARQHTVTMEQRYQELTGTATIDGRSTSITNGRVRGRQVRFSVPGEGGAGGAMTFEGALQGDVIAGTVSTGTGGTSTRFRMSR
jgi:hypothetical protein